MCRSLGCCCSNYLWQARQSNPENETEIPASESNAVKLSPPSPPEGGEKTEIPLRQRRAERGGSGGPLIAAILTAFGLPLVITGLALVGFNLYRYGDPFNTGYLPNETFSGVLWQGVLGQLVSPGRGLLLYAPVLWLSLWGVGPLFRRARPEALAAAGVILIYLLLYGQWFMWHGGYAWGPLFYGAHAAVLGHLPGSAGRVGAAKKGRSWRAALAGLALLSLLPQFLGVAVDFAPFQNSLLDTGLPLFAPQTFFAPRYSPLVGTWPYLSRANLDVAWAWRGQVNGWLLAALALNALAAGRLLWRFAAAGGRGGPVLPALAGLLTLAAVSLLLAHVHRLPAPDLQRAVAALNEATRPGDAVITNQPETAAAFAELYRGRGPVLGLNNGGFPLPDDVTRRVSEVTARHPQVWWLPNWLPPEQSGVEQILLTTGFRATNDSFGGQRLALFAFPARVEARPVEAVFGGIIQLLSAAYPRRSPTGVALPVELRWQAETSPAEDYHVFVHLVNSEGQVVAQSDGQPAMWTRPTSGWQAGEFITDRHGLWLPPDLPAGGYQLRLGLYEPDSGQRLPLASGADTVTLELDLD